MRERERTRERGERERERERDKDREKGGAQYGTGGVIESKGNMMDLFLRKRVDVCSMFAFDNIRHRDLMRRVMSDRIGPCERQTAPARD